MQRQRVHAVSDFRAEQTINGAMALNAGLANKAGAHNLDAVVGLAAGAMAGMAGVAVGLIDDLEGARIQTFGKAFGDSILHAHGGFSCGSSLGLLSRAELVKIWPPRESTLRAASRSHGKLSSPC